MITQTVTPQTELTTTAADPVPADFDALEIFTALFEAAERVEALDLEEEGTDAVTTTGLVKVLRGGSLPPARLRESDVLAVLTPEPQPVPNITKALDASPRAVIHRLESMDGVVYAPQPGARASFAWLGGSPSPPPADDEAVLAALPLPPATVPVADIAAALDVDASALARHFCLMEGVFVAHRGGALVVGRPSPAEVKSEHG